MSTYRHLWLAAVALTAMHTAAAQESNPPLTNFVPRTALEQPGAAPASPTTGSPAGILPANDARFVIERDAAYTVAFGDQFYGAVTAGNGEYFGVWVDLRTGGANPAGYDLYGQRIRPDGTVVHPGSLELLRDGSRLTLGIPAVAWNGTVYLVVWHEAGGVFGLRVDAAGKVLDPAGFFIGAHSGQHAWPAVASDGTNFLVVRASGGAVVGQRVSGGGVVLDPTPFPVSSGATGLGFPKLAFGAGVYLVAWAQTPNQAIRAARVTPGGQVLDLGGVNISGGGRDVDSHVDFDGQNFYVSWQRQNGSAWDLWGVHVNPQAQVVSGPTLLLDGGSWGPIAGGQMAFNGTHHLIAIITAEPIYSNTDQYAMMVDRQGTPVGAPFPVCTLDQRSQRSYGVAAVGDQFFILWEGNYVSGVYYVYDTEGARIDAQGNVLDRPEPLAVATCAAWQIASAASFDGNNFLCVFEDWREGKLYYQADLYGVRVSPQGQPRDTTGFQVAGGYARPQEHPDATFGGGQHVIVYENADAVAEVRLVRVRPDGTVLDPDGILVFANEPTGETFRPKVAWNGQRYAVIWNDTLLYQGQEPLQFALVNVDGSIALGPTNVPNSDGAFVYGFEIGSNGDDFLVVWVGYDSVNATRISGAGAVLGTQELQFTGNWITDLPHVAFNGQSYLAVWTKWGEAGVQVYGRRLDASGVPVGPVLNVIGPYEGASAIEVFALGSDFVVVGWYTVGNLVDMFAARFDAAGQPIGPPEVLTTLDRWETYSGSSLAMAPDGTLLAVHSLWTSDPYNTPRAQGELFRLGGRKGDLNCDDAVNFGDINPFVLALSDPDEYRRQFPDCNISQADCNGDGKIDFGDINPFVALLSR